MRLNTAGRAFEYGGPGYGWLAAAGCGRMAGWIAGWLVLIGVFRRAEFFAYAHGGHFLRILVGFIAV